MRKLRKRLAVLEARLEALEEARPELSFSPVSYEFDLDPEPLLDPRPPLRLAGEWWEDEEAKGWCPHGYL